MIDLPRFRRFMRCPKCGYDGVFETRYNSNWPVSGSGEIIEFSYLGNTLVVEAVKRTCPDCGYSEYQRPADYEEE